jgi:heme exporter protein D
MIWYWIAGLLTILALTLLVGNYLRERRYLKKKTSQAMNRQLWEEIEEEREASRGRQEKFHKALDEARRLKGES